MSGSEQQIEMLPNEIWDAILRFADHRTICIFGRTCRKFRAFSNDNDVLAYWAVLFAHFFQLWAFLAQRDFQMACPVDEQAKHRYISWCGTIYHCGPLTDFTMLDQDRAVVLNENKQTAVEFRGRWTMRRGIHHWRIRYRSGIWCGVQDAAAPGFCGVNMYELNPSACWAYCDVYDDYDGTGNYYADCYLDFEMGWFCVRVDGERTTFSIDRNVREYCAAFWLNYEGDIVEVLQHTWSPK